MGSKVEGDAEGRLKELAQAEVAAAKERLAKRTAAARDYATAVARLSEAAVTWERIQGEATAAKAKAVADLLDSEMKPTDVAELLGIETKELRALRGAISTDTAGPSTSARQHSKEEHAA